MKLLLLLATLLTLGANAREIKGEIITSEDQQPVIGANIKIKGTDHQVHSNVDGLFSIKANDGDSLEIAFPGLRTQHIKVTDSLPPRLKIIMHSDAIEGHPQYVIPPKKLRTKIERQASAAERSLPQRR